MATPSPTQETFDKLLLCLDSDRERAGEEYELLRLKLLEYFRARACFSAEEQADETLNRLAKKIDEGEEIRDILHYCYGLARWVWMEYLKKPEATKRASIEDLTLRANIPADSLVRKEQEACFKHCLQKLATGERELIIGYWEHENQTHHEARKEMAGRRQMTLTALRIRVSRIKDKLKTCYANCLEKGPPKLK